MYKEVYLAYYLIKNLSLFQDPHNRFLAFDKDKGGSLHKNEIKGLQKDAGVNSFLMGLAAGEMIKGYGKSGDDKMNKEEFKVAIAELNRNY